MFSLVKKIYQSVFLETNKAIETIKAGQVDLKNQIKSAICIIEGIQASHTAQADKVNSNQNNTNKRIDSLKQELDAVSGFYSACTDGIKANVSILSNDISEINIRNHSDSLIFAQLWAEIDALKKQVSELTTKPQAEGVTVEIEAKPEPIKATAKARTIAQPRAKASKLNATGILPWSEFQAVLKRALKVTPKRGIIPVLNTVKIEFKGNNTAIITATDLDSYYSATLESNHFHSLSGQSILINREQADKLSKVRGMVVFLSGTDRNESQDKAYTVKADNFKDFIYSLPPEDYPLTPKMSGSVILTSDLGLIPALLKSRSSQATDTAKGILTGTVLVRESADKIAIAATDGYKLFVDELSVNCGSNDWDEMILNPQLCAFLGEFKTHNNISIFRDHDFIRVELTTGEMIHSKLLCGKYPAFRKILPKQFNHTLTVKRADLLAIVTEAKPFVNKQTQIISFQINHSDITATVDQITTEIDQAATDAKHEQNTAWRRNKVAVYKTNTIYTNRLDCDLHTSEIPEKISFNRSYLEAALKGFDCDAIKIHLNSEIQPAIIRGADNDKRQIMLMPIKP